MVRLLSLPSLAVVALVPPLAAAAEGEPVERRLHADVVTASSFKWNDWNRFQENYLPLYVSDGDPRTTWTEGAIGPGEGEWLRMQVTPMEGATRVRLRIRNGYQKSKYLFEANTRPKDVTIRLLPSGTATHVTLTDSWGWQEVAAEQPAGKLEAVELKTESVYRGSKWSDQCVSDVELYVTATTRENPAFEKSKLARVKAWRAERLEAARLFKESAGQDLPLLPAYQAVSSKAAEAAGKNEKHKECAFWDDVCQIEDRLGFPGAIKEKHAEALAIALTALSGEGLAPAKMVPVDTRELPRVDGMRLPSVEDFSDDRDALAEGGVLPLAGTIASLQADKLGVLALGEGDAKTTLAEAMRSRAPGCNRKVDYKVYSWALRQKSAEGRDLVRAMVFAQCGLVGSRSGWDPTGIVQVAVYDPSGQLELTADANNLTAFEWTRKDDVPTITAAKVIGSWGDFDVSAPASE